MDENKDYSTKKYRIRHEASTLIKYLEWKSQSENVIDKFLLAENVLDKIVSTYFQKIVNKEIMVSKRKMNGRKDRSLLMSNDTHELIEDKHKLVHLTKGESIEISLFIYAQEHLTSDEIKQNGLDMWDITFKG